MKPCDDLNVDLLRYLDNDLSEQEFKYFASSEEFVGSGGLRVAVD